MQGLGRRESGKSGKRESGGEGRGRWGKKEDRNMKQWKVWGRRAMVWDSGKYKIDGGRDAKMKVEMWKNEERNKRRVHRVYLLFQQ